ncbi:hypothetical protein [Bradyrhizobium sp. CCGUVB23]|uniref:hypothetical protein n=1 Tax=Bradyrhizobium sp. CCGUVB23 TaxID=2949630 RepID=UPI0020B38CE8|nr:hypothetical protein [Bradyrhizobium sp. CCGUVB23]MCP3460910.1 hypothetical protein [Bradyrhizobium sp. CCGUVB23]
MRVIATAATTGAREGEACPIMLMVTFWQVSTFLDASIEFSRDKARRTCEPRADVVSLGLQEPETKSRERSGRPDAWRLNGRTSQSPLDFSGS